jgi:hypothetical protein
MLGCDDDDDDNDDDDDDESRRLRRWRSLRNADVWADDLDE